MTRLLQLTVIIITPILLLTIVVLIQRVDPEQRKPEIKVPTFADTLAHRSFNIDSLKKLIGDHQGVPEGFEVPAAIAYSAYPELKDVKIDMILTEQGAPMESTFQISSLLGLRKNRQYRILLNDAKNTYYNPILLRSLPLDAQVGILAHELGHIVYYHRLNIFQIAKWGLKYLASDSFRAAHERSTDLMPVYHGLGSQIYQYAYFVRNDTSCQEFYEKEKFFMDKYYMTDDELLPMIDK